MRRKETRWRWTCRWAFLEPVTSKHSQKVENHVYSVGSSSMQGWRISKCDLSRRSPMHFPSIQIWRMHMSISYRYPKIKIVRFSLFTMVTEVSGEVRMNRRSFTVDCHLGAKVALHSSKHLHTRVANQPDFSSWSLGENSGFDGALF